MKLKDNCILIGFFVLLSSCSIDFTDTPRENRISIEYKAEKKELLNECNFKNDESSSMLFQNRFPFKLGTKEFLYDTKCTFQFIGSNKVLIYLGAIRDMASYAILDTLTQKGQFIYFSDLNRFKGPSYFRYGYLAYNEPVNISFDHSGDTMVFSLDVNIFRPLYDINDIFMHKEIGQSNIKIDGCKICLYDSLTVEQVVISDLNYYSDHKGAIKDTRKYMKDMKKRLNVNDRIIEKIMKKKKVLDSLDSPSVQD